MFPTSRSVKVSTNRPLATGHIYAIASCRGHNEARRSAVSTASIRMMSTGLNQHRAISPTPSAEGAQRQKIGPGWTTALSRYNQLGPICFDTEIVNSFALPA